MICPALAAHPRSRGENVLPRLPSADFAGSSPLTRGKHFRACEQRPCARLIPAHAGKTARWRSRNGVWTAHPRSRGENSTADSVAYMPCGSSPLTRGKQTPAHHNGPRSGLIPAHAGKTERTSLSSRPPSAHPRSRGENVNRATSHDRPSGSSPLTRGKRIFRQPRDGREWLIPAHAGKTHMRVAVALSAQAHPRSRGENIFGLPFGLSGGGSSPLTRGKRELEHGLGLCVGLIPAHAGKTACGLSSRISKRAHPRSRGENISEHANSDPAHGSSPLTRGKHFPTCAFTAQIDQILETLELAVSSGSYSVWVACATDAPQDQVRSIGLVLPSSRGAS